jgi:uncharacterized protein (TIGR03067 family)
MKWQITILVAGFFTAVSIAAADDAHADLKRLEGTWQVIAIEAGGMKVDAARGAPEKAVIKDGKATFFALGKEMPTFRGLRLDLDPKKNPKAVNLVRSEKESLPCIYEVKDDQLMLAMPLVPKDRKPGSQLPRPESFETKDKPVMVLIARRSKG